MGIFIIDFLVQMLGYYVILLLCIEKVFEIGVWWVYFFNFNSQGKQDWGQGIQLMVWGNGECYGEFLFLVDEFVFWVYVFYFNEFCLEDK